MNLYSDTSVAVRALLGDGPTLPQWGQFEVGFTSALFQVEARRTLDRLRVTQAFGDDELAAAMFNLLAIERSLSMVDVTNWILERASRPMPTSVGTLDAIHLASALVVREEVPDLIFATHDRQQAIGARALGFEVIGIDL